MEYEMKGIPLALIEIMNEERDLRNVIECEVAKALLWFTVVNNVVSSGNWGAYSRIGTNMGRSELSNP
jgi:hypothetical protein